MAGRGPRAVTLARFTTDLARVIGPFLVGVIIDLAGYRVPIGIMAGLLAIGVAMAVQFAVADTRTAPVPIAA